MGVFGKVFITDQISRPKLGPPCNHQTPQQFLIFQAALLFPAIQMNLVNRIFLLPACGALQWPTRNNFKVSRLFPSSLFFRDEHIPSPTPIVLACSFFRPRCGFEYQFLSSISCLALVSACLLLFVVRFRAGNLSSIVQWRPCERKIGGEIVKIPRKPGEIQNYSQPKMQQRRKVQSKLGHFAVRRAILHTKILALLNCSGLQKTRESLAKKS